MTPTPQSVTPAPVVPSETPTPRTDAVATTHIDGEWHVSTPQVPADFARGLERKLARAEDGLEKIDEIANRHVSNPGCELNTVQLVEKLADNLTRAREEVAARKADQLELTKAYNERLRSLRASEAQLTQSLATGERLREAPTKIRNVRCERDETLRDSRHNELHAKAELAYAKDIANAALAASPHAAPAAVHEDTKRLRDALRKIAAADHCARMSFQAGECPSCVAREAHAAAPLPPTKAGEGVK